MPVNLRIVFGAFVLPSVGFARHAHADDAGPDSGSIDAGGIDASLVDAGSDAGAVDTDEFCDSNAECPALYHCENDRCVADKGALCDGDHVVYAPSGATLDCGPYRCAAPLASRVA